MTSTATVPRSRASIVAPYINRLATQTLESIHWTRIASSACFVPDPQFVLLHFDGELGSKAKRDILSNPILLGACTELAAEAAEWAYDRSQATGRAGNPKTLHGDLIGLKRKVTVDKEGSLVMSVIAPGLDNRWSIVRRVPTIRFADKQVSDAFVRAEQSEEGRIAATLSRTALQAIREAPGRAMQAFSQFRDEQRKVGEADSDIASSPVPSLTLRDGENVLRAWKGIVDWDKCADTLEPAFEGYVASRLAQLREQRGEKGLGGQGDPGHLVYIAKYNSTVAERAIGTDLDEPVEAAGPEHLSFRFEAPGGYLEGLSTESSSVADILESLGLTAPLVTDSEVA